MRVIGEFRGPWQFLSNFFIEPDGTHVEGEYQAMKCKYPADAQKFSRLSPVQAKRLGRKVEIRSDWNISRLVIMRALVARKFADHPTLRSALLATGDAELIEGNYWGDQFWGKCSGVGDNWLGRILMEIRSELR